MVATSKENPQRVKSDALLRSIRSCELFPRGKGVLVAVSGGIDSMVLLDLLHRLTPTHEWRLVVAHFNHKLRGQASRQDAEFVRATAQDMGLECTSGEGNVRDYAATNKLSLEMAARRLRHQFLCEAAQSRGLGRIALAHHADDQMELFLVRLLRGAGPDGLSGMRPESLSPFSSNIKLCRPLLEIPKTSLIQYARARGVRYREDRSNASLDFFRNKIRKKLLPLLRTQYQPALDTVIPRLMKILRAESEFLRSMVNSRSDALEFTEQPIALQRRILQAELERLGIPADFETIEFLRAHPARALCITPPGEKVAQATDRKDFLSQWELLRDNRGKLRLKRQAPAHHFLEPIEVRLATSKGHQEIEGVRLTWETKPWSEKSTPSRSSGCETFDAGRLSKRIIVRHWHQGDRFQPIGMKQAVKLQDFFTNAKVPRQLRHELLVATTLKGDIFWVEGMRIGEAFKITDRTTRSLHWQWERL